MAEEVKVKDVPSKHGYRRLTQYERFKENPFVEDTVDDVRIRKQTQMVVPTKDKAHQVHQVVDTSTGEVEHIHTAFLRIKEVEENRFVKLFVDELGALWNLKSAGMKVLTYVMATLEMNKDYVYIYPDECMVFTEYKSERTVNNGITELIEHSIIARTTRQYRYFINPLVLWSGERISFTRAYQKKQEKERNAKRQLKGANDEQSESQQPD